MSYHKNEFEVEFLEIDNTNALRSGSDLFNLVFPGPNLNPIFLCGICKKRGLKRKTAIHSQIFIPMYFQVRPKKEDQVKQCLKRGLSNLYQLKRRRGG